MSKSTTPTSFLFIRLWKGVTGHEHITMDAGISKLSLYDFLTMFLSGNLFLITIIPNENLVKGCCCNSFFTVYDGLICIIFFILAYILGMLWHKFIEWLCGLNISKKISIKLFNVFSSFIRNDPNLIYKAEQRVLSRPDINDNCKHTDDDNLRRYYFGYYYLQEKQALGIIPLLEAQEAFVRDIIIPLCTFLITGICCKCKLPHTILESLNILINSNCAKLFAALIIFLLGVFLMIVHHSIQMKIYELVWDGSYYISHLKEMR